MAFSSLCPNFPLFIRTPIIGWEPTLIPKMTSSELDYTYKDTISKYSYFLRYGGGMNLGGHYPTQGSLPSAPPCMLIPHAKFICPIPAWTLSLKSNWNLNSKFSKSHHLNHANQVRFWIWSMLGSDSSPVSSSFAVSGSLLNAFFLSIPSTNIYAS